MHEIRELTSHLSGAAHAQFVVTDRASTGMAAAAGRPAWSTGVMLPATNYLEPVTAASVAEQLWLARVYPGATMDLHGDHGAPLLRTLGRLGVAMVLLRGQGYGHLLEAARQAQEAGLVPVLQPSTPLGSEQVAGLWFDLLAAGADESACFVVVPTGSTVRTRAQGKSGPDFWELPAVPGHALTGLAAVG